MAFLKSALLLLFLLALSLSLYYDPQSHQQEYHSQSTGLSWQYCSPTILNSCPEPLLLNWGQALRYCTQLQWESFTDWRLPNRTEILSLINRQKRTPAISDFLAQDTKDNVYWSSSTDSEQPELAYYISFFSGNSYANSKRVQAYVRCVR